MNETKRCPACNQQVPVLAVRCKFCGVRLDAASSTAVDAFAPTADPPPSYFEEDLDLDADLDVDLEEDLPEASMPNKPRISAPPPARRSAPPAVSSSAAPIPPAVAPRASVPPPVASRISAPPVSVSTIPPAGSVAVPPPSAPPPPPASEPPRSPVVPVSQTPPAAVPAEPDVDKDVSSAKSPLTPAAVPPLSGKRTLLGMAPPVLPPNAEASLPRPSSASPALAPPTETAVDDSAPTMAEGVLDMPGGSLLGDDDFDSLDLDGDILDDDIDEISKFTEQTAITDVSTLAMGMSDGAPNEPDSDVPADLLDEIMDSVPPAALPMQEDLSLSNGASPAAGSTASLEPGAPELEPLGPLLESEPESDFLPPDAPKKRSTTIFLTLLGAGMFVAGGLIAYKVLTTEEGDESDNVSAVETEGKPADEPAGAAAEPPPSAAASETPAAGEEPAKQEPALAPKFPTHKCRPLSEYPSFAWRDKLDELAKSSDKADICGLFGLSKEAVVTAFQKTPNFGPTGYDLLPKSTVFEIFPLGKADRRAPTVEFLFMDDLLYEIRMKFGMSNADSLDSSVFKPLLGKADTVPGDPLEREIKIYTDEDLVILWYKKTDAFKRVFNEVVFSSRITRADFEKDFKNRNDAQIAFEQGTALYNQKKVEQAVLKFRKARQTVPAMGKAYIFEGIALLQNEQFDKIEDIAAQAFKNSTDDRARAGAKGLQAVAALYNGDKESALMLFNNAAGLDPADSEYSFSVEELKTGEYDPARTAKTAARMDCRRSHPEWSVKGLLARGNFPDNATFQKAKKESRKKAEYKSAFKMWDAWECR